MAAISLYQDSAGGIYIGRDDEETIIDVRDAVYSSTGDERRFADDARDLLATPQDFEGERLYRSASRDERRWADVTEVATYTTQDGVRVAIQPYRDLPGDFPLNAMKAVSRARLLVTIEGKRYAFDTPDFVHAGDAAREYLGLRWPSRGGRPPKPQSDATLTARLEILLTPDLKEWAIAHGGAAFVRQLLTDERARRD